MTIENIDAATLRKWQEADKAVIVDVREPVEYDAEHIEGAALVPLGRLRRAALPSIRPQARRHVPRGRTRAGGLPKASRRDVPAGDDLSSGRRPRRLERRWISGRKQGPSGGSLKICRSSGIFEMARPVPQIVCKAGVMRR